MSDEKTTADLEAQDTASATTLSPPNNTHLETEKKIETASVLSVDSADYDHDEVEAMDAGRQTDLGIDRVSFRIRLCCKSRIHANTNSRSIPAAWSRPLPRQEHSEGPRRRAAGSREC